ncbi:MAG: type II toxin-antitoxin system VapC family toxin [Protaetiibacter sp.]
MVGGPVRRCYFDSSAVVKLVGDEAFTDDVARWVDDPRVEAVTGRLTETEVRRAVERDGSTQEIATAVLERFDVYEHPTWEFRAAGTIPGRSLRSLDAIHIAAAIRVEADAIISYDERMIEAAAAMGLPAIQPGVDEGGIRRIPAE